MQILQFFSQLVSDSAKCLQLLAGRTGPHTTPENMMWKLELSNPTVQLVLYTIHPPGNNRDRTNTRD